MKFPLRFVLILTAVIVAAFLVLVVACGGDEKEKTPTASPTAAAEKTPTASPTTAAEKTPTAGETPEKTPAGEAGELPSIPAYPGAEEVFTGTLTGAAAFPIPMTGDVPIAPEDYGSVQYSVYQTSDSADKVVDFYKSEFKDWKQEGSFSIPGQKGQVVVWTKDNRNVAAWMGAFEEQGATSVVIAMGARQ